MQKENLVQAQIIKEIKQRFPDAIVLKNDPNYIQGMPDLVVLNKGKYALLECKRSSSEPFRPNQEYYIQKQNDCGAFASMICPENKEEVFNALEQTFRT